jgi:hypothetical protein
VRLKQIAAVVECWYDCAATHRRKIQIVQNKQLKIIMDHHWRHSTEALHEEAGVPLIEDFSQLVTLKNKTISLLIECMVF